MTTATTTTTTTTISCETNVHDSSCYSDYKINTTNTICVSI